MKNIQYRKFKLLEDLLQICGFKGIDDTVTMISQKELKNMPGVIASINNRLKTDEKLAFDDFLPNQITDESRITPMLRSLMDELYVPYKLVHKTSGNYLKLHIPSYDRNHYRIQKIRMEEQQTQCPVVVYKSFSAFQEKYPVYQSLTKKGAELLSFFGENKDCGIYCTENKVYRNFRIFKAEDNKYYAQIEIERDYDVYRNIHAYINSGDIIVKSVVPIITNGDNIIQNPEILPMVALQYSRLCANIEIDLATINSGTSIVLIHDGIMLDTLPRRALAQDAVTNYGSFKVNHGMMTEVIGNEKLRIKSLCRPNMCGSYEYRLTGNVEISYEGKSLICICYGKNRVDIESGDQIVSLNSELNGEGLAWNPIYLNYHLATEVILNFDFDPESSTPEILEPDNAIVKVIRRDGSVKFLCHENTKYSTGD